MIRNLAYFLAGLLVAIGITSFAQLRLEAAAGGCHAHAQGQGEWWSDVGGSSFTSSPLRSGCYQLGVSQLVKGFGWRASIVDLGRMKLNEDAWSGYGPQPHWSSAGEGRAYGFTLGGLIERRFGKWSPSAEVGVLEYRSSWDAICSHHASSQDADVSPGARWRGTWYAGVGLSYHLTERLALTASVRRYADVRADTRGANGDVIGPSSMSVMQTLVGLSVAL